MGKDEDSLKEALIEELTLLHDELGVPPRTIDMGKHGRFSPGLYSAEFGSWKEALMQAGIEDEPHRPPEGVEVNMDGERGYESPGPGQAEEGVEATTGEEPEGTDDLDEEQKLLVKNAERMDGIPAPEDLRRRGHSVNGILEEYGTWEDALASAGIEVPENAGFGGTNRRGGRHDRLLEEVRKYEGVHGDVPTESDVEATEWMSDVGEYTEEFGAVWRAVDLTRRGTEGAEDGSGDGRSESDLTRELKLYYLRNGEAPTRDDVREDESLSELSDYIDAFGDLRAAADSAGVTDHTDERGSEGDRASDG